MGDASRTASEEDEVSWLQAVEGDPGSGVVLGLRCPRQSDSSRGVGRLGQTRAVESTVPVGGFSELTATGIEQRHAEAVRLYLVRYSGVLAGCVVLGWRDP